MREREKFLIGKSLGNIFKMCTNLKFRFVLCLRKTSKSVNLHMKYLGILINLTYVSIQIKITGKTDALSHQLFLPINNKGSFIFFITGIIDADIIISKHIEYERPLLLEDVCELLHMPISTEGTGMPTTSVLGQLFIYWNI